MSKIMKVGIVGCGAIGSEIARFIDSELKKFYRLTAVCDIDERKTRVLFKNIKAKPRVLKLHELIRACDMVIESASIQAAQAVLQRTLGLKKTVVILSVGAFAQSPEFVKEVDSGRATVYIPSGAISGIDGIASLSYGSIKRVKLITSKSPSSLSGVPYLERKGIDVFKIKNEKTVFEGTIKEAITHFPKNINVAATLFLASRFKGIRVAIRVVPRLKRNIHRILVDSSQGKLSLTIENVPSEVNPKTSFMTVLSAKCLLKKLVSPLRVGS